MLPGSTGRAAKHGERVQAAAARNMEQRRRCSMRGLATQFWCGHSPGAWLGPSRPGPAGLPSCPPTQRGAGVSTARSGAARRAGSAAWRRTVWRAMRQHAADASAQGREARRRTHRRRRLALLAGRGLGAGLLLLGVRVVLLALLDDVVQRQVQRRRGAGRERERSSLHVDGAGRGGRLARLGVPAKSATRVARQRCSLQRAKP